MGDSLEQLQHFKAGQGDAPVLIKIPIDCIWWVSNKMVRKKKDSPEQLSPPWAKFRENAGSWRTRGRRSVRLWWNPTVLQSVGRRPRTASLASRQKSTQINLRSFGAIGLIESMVRAMVQLINQISSEAFIVDQFSCYRIDSVDVVDIE